MNDTSTEPTDPPTICPALAGLRVVDFTTTLTGAHIGQLLADFGAEVTMVEPPGGNPLRSEQAWPFWARGKQSIVLDLQAHTDRATAQHLAAAAEVVLQTWRPGVAERLGLSLADLSPANPRVIVASVTGFGRTGPLSGLKGYEGVVMAKVGAFDAYSGITPRPGPAYTSAPFASFSASQTALHGILAALLERERSGLGQQVDVSLAQSLAAHDTWNWLIAMLVKRYGGAFTAARPVDEESGAPNSHIFFRLMVGLSKDGRWMQLSQTTDKLWHAFLRMVGLGQMIDDGVDPSSDPDPQVRLAWWEQLLSIVRSKTYDEWLAEFDRDTDVWAETFRSGTELLDHPQMVHDHQVVTVPVAGLGPVRQPGPMVTMFTTPGHSDGAVPRLDEQGDALRASATEVPAGHAVQAGATTAPPLAGVTVVEFGTFYAGPFGATLLADLGARVIKLEPIEGDPIRSIMPFPEVGGVKVMQGKESVAVDIASPEGREIADELVRRADVVLQCFRAGVAERLGYDYERLRTVNPGIVYLNAPGYGTGGPCGHRPAFAPTIGAGSGLAMRNIGPSIPEHTTDLEMAEVRKVTTRMAASTMGYAHADGFSALGAATALLLGMVAKARTGIAQEMTTTMLSTLAHALAEGMTEYEGQPQAPTADPELYGLNALYRLYPAADDGWVFLASPQVREWTDLAAALAPWVDLGVDSRFGDEASRRANDTELSEVLAGVLCRRPAADWERDLVAADVACVEVAKGPVESHVTDGEGMGREHGYVVDCEHPVLGEYVRLSPIVKFSRSTGVAGPAGLCGQQTDSVLTELGYDAARIADLRARGIAGG